MVLKRVIEKYEPHAIGKASVFKEMSL